MRPRASRRSSPPYVAETSHARFTGMAGLRYQTWRMVRGEWFEGSYVFATTEAREETA